MASVKFNRKEFEKQIKLTEEIKEKINLFGTHLESLTEEEIELEILPNRPDLFSIHGFLRSFSSFVGAAAQKNYKVNAPEKNYKVKITSNVHSVRPYTTCAIIKDLSLTEDKIKNIIDLQEKLHSTLGRKRKKFAIGIYPLEKIKLPIVYDALPPTQIKFIPLETEKEMSATQILSDHPIGKEYSHLLEGLEKFPVFKDAENKILSLPPLINSHDTGKVTEKTREVFVECSGFDPELLNKTLNNLVTTLADMGGKIYAIELDYGDKKITTPDLSSSQLKISIEKTNKVLGTELKEKDLEKLLPKMGYIYKNKSVKIPPWRTDVLHEIDIIEDIAIAHGYDKIIPEIPNVATIGEESHESKIKSKLTEILLGLKLLEVSSYHLIKKQEVEIMKIESPLFVKDSKTDFKCLRPNLLIPFLRIFSENKDHEYPQEIFEIGTVFIKNKTETGVREKENLIIACAPANFTRIKQIADYLFSQIGIRYNIKEISDDIFVEGRTASFEVKDKKIGIMGEIHPKILKEWNIKMPLAVVEISLEEIF